MFDFKKYPTECGNLGLMWRSIFFSPFSCKTKGLGARRGPSVRGGKCFDGMDRTHLRYLLAVTVITKLNDDVW